MHQIVTAMTVVACGCFASLIAAQAKPTHVMRAGEWESRVGGAPKRLICLKADRPFDPVTLTKMSDRVSAKCHIGDVNETGAAITYVTMCDIAGGHMVVHGTITVDSDDSYISRSKSHFEGGQVRLPDMDLTVTSHRVGPCQPGDTQSPF